MLQNVGQSGCCLGTKFAKSETSNSVTTIATREVSEPSGPSESRAFNLPGKNFTRGTQNYPNVLHPSCQTLACSSPKSLSMSCRASIFAPPTWCLKIANDPVQPTWKLRLPAVQTALASCRGVICGPETMCWLCCNWGRGSPGFSHFGGQPESAKIVFNSTEEPVWQSSLGCGVFRVFPGKQTQNMWKHDIYDMTV